MQRKSLTSPDLNPQQLQKLTTMTDPSTGALLGQKATLQHRCMHGAAVSNFTVFLPLQRPC
jgi:hypothetical protein